MISSFLAIAQWRDADLLSISQPPILDEAGRGATARIHQSRINPEVSFAFNRIKSSTFKLNENEIFRLLVSKVVVLGDPFIKNVESIVKLRGICLDVTNDGNQGVQVLPVLVFDRAEYGELGQFMDSELGKALSLAQRLDLCIDIATALMWMHACYS